jgi:hypothetical protein
MQLSTIRSEPVTWIFQRRVQPVSVISDRQIPRLQ